MQRDFLGQLWPHGTFAWLVSYMTKVVRATNTPLLIATTIPWGRYGQPMLQTRQLRHRRPVTYTGSHNQQTTRAGFEPRLCPPGRLPTKPHLLLHLSSPVPGQELPLETTGLPKRKNRSRQEGTPSRLLRDMAESSANAPKKTEQLFSKKQNIFFYCKLFANVHVSSVSH